MTPDQSESRVFEFRRPRRSRVAAGDPVEEGADEPTDLTTDEPTEEPTEEPAEDVAEEPAEAVGAGERPRVGLGLWLLLAVAIASVVLAALAWRSAEDDPERARAAARDLAMIQGVNAVETMNTMDHRDVEAGVQAWQEVSTGVLRDQLIAIDEDQKKLIADQGKIATGHVVQAALTDLSDRTARMIVAVEVTVRDGDTDAEPVVKRNRYAADLALVDGAWKLEDIQQVAVML